MDAALKGHPYVKSGIDIACWDILGQAAGLPVCELLGGRYGEDVQLYRAISQESPDAMAGAASPAIAPRATAASNSRSAAIPTSTSRASAPSPAMLQTGDRLVADANTGWMQHEAMRVVKGGARRRRLHRAAVPDLRGVPRRPPAHADHPFVLDENIDGLDMLLRAKADLAMDVVNLKISKLGGLTQDRAGPRPVRQHGHRDDARGQLGRRHRHRRHRAPRPQHADRVAVHHAPTSTATSPCRTADGAPQRVNGRMAASTRRASASRRGWTCSAPRWSPSDKAAQEFGDQETFLSRNS